MTEAANSEDNVALITAVGAGAATVVVILVVVAVVCYRRRSVVSDCLCWGAGKRTNGEEKGKKNY